MQVAHQVFLFRIYPHSLSTAGKRCTVSDKRKNIRRPVSKNFLPKGCCQMGRYRHLPCYFAPPKYKKKDRQLHGGEIIGNKAAVKKLTTYASVTWEG
jgi:hypothetical protein